MIAFGAVATGSMNAQEAEIAAGIISSSGGMPVPIAAAASTGMSSVAVAVLEVISVRKVTVRQMTRISTNTGNAARPPSPCPISCDSPLAVNAVAMQIPPANRSSMPQGIEAARSQSSSRSPSPSGTRNIRTTAASATVESATVSIPSRPDHPPNGSERVIHATIVSPNTTSTRSSGDRQGPGCRTSIGSDPLSLRDSQSAMSGMAMAATGRPVSIQRTKPYSSPVVCS